MVRKGLHPDVVTYSALIDGYCLRGELGEAHKVLDRMVKRGMKPNIITYSSLINGYCKNKKVNEALDVFRDIQNKGLIPDVFTYNSMMQGLFETKNPVAATQLFNEMLAKGLNPDILMVSCLMECATTQVSDALVLFRLKPTIMTYTVVIHVLFQNGLFDKAKELLKKMEEDGCLPSSGTYNAIV
ncbi:putative tetratricopeptide-like helical domain-containing protein [Tanacetum coccineum]